MLPMLGSTRLKAKKCRFRRLGMSLRLRGGEEGRGEEGGGGEMGAHHQHRVRGQARATAVSHVPAHGLIHGRDELQILACLEVATLVLQAREF